MSTSTLWLILWVITVVQILRLVLKLRIYLRHTRAMREAEDAERRRRHHRAVRTSPAWETKTKTTE